MTETTTETAKPKAAPKGLPVLPVRSKSTMDAETGPFMVIKAFDTPWTAPDKEPALRLLRCSSEAQVKRPGSKITLHHAKSKTPLGTYTVIAKADGKLSVWDLNVI